MPVQGTLPLVGRVAAGSPILALENVEARYRLDVQFFTPRADYLLRVRGASMQGAGILDGDLLAVHKSADARTPGRSSLPASTTRSRSSACSAAVATSYCCPRIRSSALSSSTQQTAFAIEGIAVGLVRGGKAW